VPVVDEAHAELDVLGKIAAKAVLQEQLPRNQACDVRQLTVLPQGQVIRLDGFRHDPVAPVDLHEHVVEPEHRLVKQVGVFARAFSARHGGDPFSRQERNEIAQPRLGRRKRILDHEQEVLAARLARRQVPRLRMGELSGRYPDHVRAKFMRDFRRMVHAARIDDNDLGLFEALLIPQ
jgi:hypothetical protein